VCRYKEDVTSEQKEALLRLLKKHSHRGITDDIRREIVYSRSRDNEVPLEREPLAVPMAED
jgi:essential nuclear protein 1